MLSGIRWKYVWIILLSVAVVVSHYSIAYMSILLLGGTLALLLTMRREVQSYLVTAFGVLLVASVIWTGFIAKMPGATIVNLIKLPSLEARAYAVEEYYTYKTKITDVGFNNARYNETYEAIKNIDADLVRKRDTVIEQAFGKGLAQASLFGKIKWLAVWLWMIALCVGEYLMIKKRHKYNIPIEFIALSLTCVVGMILWVIVPYISINYGIGRVYFQASVIFVVPLGIFIKTVLTFVS